MKTLQLLIIQEYSKLRNIVICLIASSLKDPKKELVKERLDSIQELDEPFDKERYWSYFINIENINDYFSNIFDYPYRRWSLTDKEIKLMEIKYPHLIDHLNHIPDNTLLYVYESDDEYIFNGGVNAFPL
eukprot:gene12617-6521_t